MSSTSPGGLEQELALTLKKLTAALRRFTPLLIAPVFG
jgi:hypothetical protein